MEQILKTEIEIKAIEASNYINLNIIQSKTDFHIEGCLKLIHLFKLMYNDDDHKTHSQFVSLMNKKIEQQKQKIEESKVPVNDNMYLEDMD